MDGDFRCALVDFGFLTVVLNNRVWALAKGPYSSVLALTWESAASAKLVALFEGGSLTWEVRFLCLLLPLAL